MGAYDQNGEIAIQSILAPVLIASLCAIAVLLANQLLPLWPSVIVALGLAFGTQVWITASRSLWSHSWLLMLHTLAVWLLLRDATGARRVNGWLLGSLMAWSYFVRPSSAIAIGAIGLYLLVTRREALAGYAVAGLGWLGGFVAYSWTHFGTLMPTYFQIGWVLESYERPGGSVEAPGLLDGGGSVLSSLKSLLTQGVMEGVIGSLISHGGCSSSRPWWRSSSIWRSDTRGRRRRRGWRAWLPASPRRSGCWWPRVETGPAAIRTAHG